MASLVSAGVGAAANAVMSGLQGSRDTFNNQQEWYQWIKQKQADKKYGLDEFDKSFIYNSALANYQNELALQNWNRENVYNSPEQQMQRYLAAGLNPNLVYGAGASSGNAGNIGTPSVGGSFSPTELMDVKTRQRAQKISAANTAVGMLSQATDLFSKLLTVRGQIQAENAENLAKTAIGKYNTEYWNLRQPKVFDYANRDFWKTQSEYSESLLRNAIADYKLGMRNENFMDEVGNVGTPIYVQDINNRLDQQQVELQYQGLKNGFQDILNQVAGHPVFGRKAFASKEMQLLEKKLGDLQLDSKYPENHFLNLGTVIQLAADLNDY